DGRLHHAQLPVAVAVGAVDDLRQVDGAQHGGEAVDVRPARVGVADDLGGPWPDRAGPAGLQGRVAVRVVLDHRGPGVHDLDGLLGVLGVPGDVPGESHRVRG